MQSLVIAEEFASDSSSAGEISDVEVSLENGDGISNHAGDLGSDHHAFQVPGHV